MGIIFSSIVKDRKTSTVYLYSAGDNWVCDFHYAIIFTISAVNISFSKSTAEDAVLINRTFALICLKLQRAEVER